MIIDNYNTVVLEQVAFPGNIGDSCAESARYAILTQDGKINLAAFVTDKGVIRHPTSPWGPEDVSSDQVMPLLAASSVLQPLLANRIVDQIKKAGYKTGNGNYINPGLYATIRRHENRPWLWMSDLAILGQALLFKLPLRWDENKKRLVKNEDVSDYLNYTIFLKHAELKKSMTWPCKLALFLTGKKQVLPAVQKYYSPEPNNSMILDAYNKDFPNV